MRARAGEQETPTTARSEGSAKTTTIESRRTSACGHRETQLRNVSTWSRPISWLASATLVNWPLALGVERVVYDEFPLQDLVVREAERAN